MHAGAAGCARQVKGVTGQDCDCVAPLRDMASKPMASKPMASKMAGDSFACAAAVSHEHSGHLLLAVCLDGVQRSKGNGNGCGLGVEPEALNQGVGCRPAVVEGGG